MSDASNRDIWHTYTNASLVVQYKPGFGVIIVSGLTKRSAKILRTPSVYDLFGYKGLREIYSRLSNVLGTGVGGRDDIGGSERGLSFTGRDARSAIVELDKLVQCSLTNLKISKRFLKRCFLPHPVY